MMKVSGVRQWRIQDFPEMDAKPERRGANLLFGKFFAENCIKIERRRL